MMVPSRLDVKESLIVPETDTVYWHPSLVVRFAKGPSNVPLKEPINTSGGIESELKVAVTDWFVFMVIEQDVAVPLHAPDQPPKVEPVAGVSVSVTEAPLAKPAEHVVPQLISPPLTLPAPLPALLTVSVSACGGAAITVTVVAALAAPPGPLAVSV